MHGEILAILGENGCGKTTLMNMIAGIYFPDSGEIFVDGQEVVIRSPKDAFRYKIGMIHQHFKLVDVFTASENIVLGVKDGTRYNIKNVNERVKEISDRETIVKKVTIVPLEVIVRNIIAGSLSKRVGEPEGTPLKCPVIEYSFKNDDLGDPMVNEYHIKAMGWATEEEINTIANYALKVNQLLSDYLKGANIELVDFKLEFGKTSDGTIVLADEISPDTCRFWDSTTHEKLDKDRFRRDLGGEEDAYKEILKRLLGE